MSYGQIPHFLFLFIVAPLTRALKSERSQLHKTNFSKLNSIKDEGGGSKNPSTSPPPPPPSLQICE